MWPICLFCYRIWTNIYVGSQCVFSTISIRNEKMQPVENTGFLLREDTFWYILFCSIQMARNLALIFHICKTLREKNGKSNSLWELKAPTQFLKSFSLKLGSWPHPLLECGPGHVIPMKVGNHELMSFCNNNS